MNAANDPPVLDPPDPPASPSEPDREAPAAGARPVAVRVTAGLAVVGVVLAIIGVVVATRTVRTPLQDCGVAAAFLLDGRVDVVGDPDAPPAGTTRDEVLDNNEDRCQERAANQARPGAALVVAGTGLGLVAATAETAIRWRWRRRRRPVIDHDPT